MSRLRPILLEAIQFAPILTLASTFVVTGEVDLDRAGTLFVVAAAGALVITVALVAARARLNPILLGTNVWLWVGALAFGIPLEGLAGVLAELRAVGLFACVLGVCGALTVVSPSGCLGAEIAGRRRTLLGSAIVLGLTAAALGWAWLFVEDIRIGGGLPFILLNVSRRILLRRLR